MNGLSLLYASEDNRTTTEDWVCRADTRFLNYALTLDMTISCTLPRTKSIVPTGHRSTVPNADYNSSCAES